MNSICIFSRWIEAGEEVVVRVKKKVKLFFKNVKVRTVCKFDDENAMELMNNLTTNFLPIL